MLRTMVVTGEVDRSDTCTVMELGLKVPGSEKVTKICAWVGAAVVSEEKMSPPRRAAPTQFTHSVG